MEFMGYEHWGEAVRGEGSGQWKTHTHTVSLCYTEWMEPRAMIGRDLDTCKRGPPLFKLLGYEYREDA